MCRAYDIHFYPTFRVSTLPVSRPALLPFHPRGTCPRDLLRV